LLDFGTPPPPPPPPKHNLDDLFGPLDEAGLAAQLRSLGVAAPVAARPSGSAGAGDWAALIDWSAELPAVRPPHESLI